MPTNPDSMLLTREDLQSLIDDLERRFTPVAERVESNRAHVFALPEKDPLMPAHLGDVTPYQWRGPARKWHELKVRLTENPAAVRAKPARDTASWREKANNLEEVMTSGLALVEERGGFNIAESLADGQIIDGAAFLHCVKAAHIWPEVPEKDYLEELPEDVAKDYERDHERGGYVETDSAYQKRRRFAQARAGFPWHIEVLRRGQVWYLPDRSLSNGMGMVVVMREVGTLDYLDRIKVQESGKRAYSISEATGGKVAIYGERDAPAENMPSREVWGEILQIYEVWTRGEFYEIARGSGRNWEIMKCGNHPYRMPPFWKCSGNAVNDPDPLLADQPLLEEMISLKPAYDRWMTLFLALSETAAMPLVYWRNVKDGTPLLDEGQQVVKLTRNSLNAYKAPDGYELATIDFNLNEAFIAGGQMLRELADESAPGTGYADVSAAAEAWSIRLQQAQENVEPSKSVTAIARCMTAMVRKMVEVMGLPLEEGGFGEPVCVFKRVGGEHGGFDRGEAVYVEPEDIGSLDVYVDISSTSAQERITKVEHGKGLHEGGYITYRTWAEDYYGAQDPDKMLKEKRAEELVNMYLPQILQQELAAKMGQRVVIGGDGQPIGVGGQSVDPYAALEGQGVMFPQRAQQMGGAAPGSVFNPNMPDLAGLQEPTTPALNGMVG